MNPHDRHAPTLSKAPPDREAIRIQIGDLLMGTHRLTQSQIVASVDGSPEEILTVLGAMEVVQLVYVRRGGSSDPTYSSHRL